jgi:hypothetical protein
MEPSKPGFPRVPLPVQLVMSNAPREAGLVEALEACREEARLAVHPAQVKAPTNKPTVNRSSTIRCYRKR